MPPPVTPYDNGTTWTQWSTTSASSTAVIWPLWLWCDQGTASTSIPVWQNWTCSNVSYAAAAYVEPSPEERERRAAEAAERRRLAEEAKERARILLREVLDETQCVELERDGYFHVQTKDGERVYRLKPGSPPQRVKGEDGSRWSFCIHPRESFPPDDVVAAHKLMIEADEDAFLRIANATHLGRMQEPVAA